MIVAEHVTKYYGARAAVFDLSFRIHEGEVVGLLGLNGAGKTTTLKILSGLLVPTSGRVQVAGLDMREQPEEVRARIGFLPEVPPLYPEMAVAEYLTFVAHIKGVKGSTKEAVAEALKATDLVGVADQPIGTLSNGYQRRVGIAQAIVHRPALILLDEPTSGLDPRQIVQMRELIRSLHDRHTILVSSHLLSEIHQVCDRIFVLKDGRIAAEGAESELASRMSAATNIAVEVRGEPDKLERVLKELKFVRRRQLASPSKGLVEAHLELAEDKREELARAIVGADLGLVRLERTRIELENIFLELTAGAAEPNRDREGAANEVKGAVA